MPEKYSPGDTIEVAMEGKTLTGVVMPRVSQMDQNILVIKLSSGYNLGITKKNIKSITVKKQHSPPKISSKPLKKNPKLPTVSILSFGGTISSKVDYRTGGVYADYTAEDFIHMIPEMKDVANLEAKKINSLMSEDMAWDEWVAMAKAIIKELNKKEVDGVVITQGTDTLHYSAAALSFFLSKVNKPVVITAAQKSIDRGSSDAFMNLLCSVQAAANFDGAEVVSCMHATSSDESCFLIRGTKVRKMHTSRRDAFRPINDKPLAKVFPDGTIETIQSNYQKRNTGDPELDITFEPKIAQILAYPGQDKGIIDYYLDKGYKGIVITATALGHVCTMGKHSLLEGMKKATKKGVPVIIASQTLYGRVHPHVYTNLRKLSIDAGAIFSEDIMPEVAYIKLGYVLGKTKDMDKIKELMLTNLRGELNARLQEDDFLY